MRARRFAACGVDEGGEIAWRCVSVPQLARPRTANDADFLTKTRGPPPVRAALASCRLGGVPAALVFGRRLPGVGFAWLSPQQARLGQGQPPSSTRASPRGAAMRAPDRHPQPWGRHEAPTDALRRPPAVSGVVVPRPAGAPPPCAPSVCTAAVATASAHALSRGGVGGWPREVGLGVCGRGVEAHVRVCAACHCLPGGHRTQRRRSLHLAAADWTSRHGWQRAGCRGEGPPPVALTARRGAPPQAYTNSRSAFGPGAHTEPAAAAARSTVVRVAPRSAVGTRGSSRVRFFPPELFYSWCRCG